MADYWTQSKPRRLDPAEAFRTRGNPVGVTIGDFWQWAYSDLVANTTRGILAEFVVANALGLQLHEPRTGWSDHDLVIGDRIRIEIKATGHIQSWTGRATPPVFGRLRGRRLSEDGARYEGSPAVRCDVFIFAEHTAQTHEAFDPTDLDQWRFFVAPAYRIAELDQDSVRLSRVWSMAEQADFGGLKTVVQRAAAANRSLSR